jgi:hypothetical protein
MSWDVFAQNFPDVASAEDVPDDFEPAPLGPRDALIARMIEAVPGADFSDPSWGLVEQDGWSIEINIGEEAECDSFALHVRGGGDGAIETVAAILDATGVRAIDAQTGEFFELEAARESFGLWQDFRDKVVREHQPKRGWFSRLFGR